MNSEAATEKPLQKKQRPAFVTAIAILVCVIVFIGLAAEQQSEHSESLAKWGALSSVEIWNGAFWSLVTSAFVHLGFWHLLFNLYWIWLFGSAIERNIGSGRYLVFYLVAAFVSSAFQLALSDATGIGASGVVYAFFGFMWVSRSEYPQFREVLSQRMWGISVIHLFLFWLLLCFPLTYFGILPVGNAAHVSGLVFGGVIAAHFVLRKVPVATFPVAAGMIVLPLVSLVWCPWSVEWLSHRAYTAQMRGETNEALEFYNRVLERDPDNAWAYHNRGTVYEKIGRPKKANADWKKAHRLDPSYGVPE